MFIRRPVQIIAVALTFAACSSPDQSAAATPDAAAAPAAAPVAAAPAAPAASPVNLSVRWDSGPLDRDYRAQRAALDERHAQELAHPRPNETVVVRTQRHTAETAALELRYTNGKNLRVNILPPR